MGSRRTDQPDPLSGQEEGSSIALAFLPVTQLGPQDREEPRAREGPAPLTWHRTSAGPDLGAGFHPLFTLPSVPWESLRWGCEDSLYSSGLLP